MMILSRLWYLILALVVGAAVYIVYLAVGQYNRRNTAAMEETLKADSQVVSWAMQVDARRRIDVLLLAAVDPNVAKALGAANGKDQIPPASRDEGAKALRAFNDKAGDYKSDALFAVDRDGRVIAQINYDAANAFPEFELGGYAAVYDALHGFLRDDTWIWGGRIARVVARPVEAEVGQPPIGAVVGLKWVDNAYAKEIGKRTRTSIAFFALGQRVASAALEGGTLDETTLETIGSDLGSVATDKQFKDVGRTDVRPLGTDDRGGVLYVRLPGDAWELGAGFAVARPKVTINSPTGFITGADDADKRYVKLWLVALVIFGGFLIGLLFSYLEHSMPVGEMRKQAAKLKRGELDMLQLPRFRGGLRPIATDINDGIQRVVEKGGGQARKPADLESILGPVPAQPNMSAFSFPMPDGSAATQAPAMSPPGFNNAPPAFSPPPAVPSRPGGGPPPPVRPGAGAPPPPGGFQDRTVAMGAANNAAAAPPPFPAAGAPPPPPHSATVAASPAAQKLGHAPTAPAPFPTPPGAPPLKRGDDEDEQTMVAQPSADLIAATGQNPAANDPAAEWHQVYEEFIRTKRECGEPTDGLTFEKFQQTLKKNRDALMQRHGCKRVKFSVYVKEGRASLKATPVRE
jgi:hypothetical protein